MKEIKKIEEKNLPPGGKGDVIEGCQRTEKQRVRGNHAQKRKNQKKTGNDSVNRTTQGTLPLTPPSTRLWLLFRRR